MHPDELQSYRVRFAGALGDWVAVTAHKFDKAEGAYRFWTDGKQTASFECASVAGVICEGDAKALEKMPTAEDVSTRLGMASAVGGGVANSYGEDA